MWLCATVVAPRLAWGALLNGRQPTKKEEQFLYKACAKAVRGSQGPGRAARPLGNGVRAHVLTSGG